MNHAVHFKSMKYKVNKVHLFPAFNLHAEINIVQYFS